MSDPVKSNLLRSPSSPSYGTLLRIYSTGTLLVAIALLTFLCLTMETYCRPYCTQLKDPFLNCVYTFSGITGKLTFRNSQAVIG